jgi:hypothetical protein
MTNSEMTNHMGKVTEKALEEARKDVRSRGECNDL